MEGFTPYFSFSGGVLIGLAAVALLYFNGRIAGLSGIVDGVLHPERSDFGWRVVFVAGLLCGAALIHLFFPAAMQVQIDVSLPAVLAGGLLVGFGTRLGSGCTSGHGVCGVGRLAPRSMIASAVFVGAAMITTYIIRHVLGGI